MKRWEERTLFQQLTIIFCFIFALIAAYLLLVKVPGPLLSFFLTVALPLLILWVIFWEAVEILRKPSETAVPAGSTTDTKHRPKRPIKEKLIIWAGITFCIPLSICLYKSHFIFGIVWAIGLTVMVVKGVLKTMREKQRPPETMLPTVKRKWKITNFAGTLVLWIWMIGFLIPFFSTILSFSEMPMSSSIIRSPLGIPGGIAADGNGRIYYVSNSYNRIQVYDKNGRFLQGWFFTIPGNLSKTVQIIIDKRNRIHVEAGYYEDTYPINEPDRKVYTVFTPTGKLLEKRSETFSYTKIPDVFERKAPDGNIYKVKHRHFFPKVLRVSPSGEETVIVSDPFYLKFIDFPVPSAVCIFAVSITYGLWEFWQKRRKAKENADSQAISTV